MAWYWVLWYLFVIVATLIVAANYPRTVLAALLYPLVDDPLGKAALVIIGIPLFIDETNDWRSLAVWLNNRWPSLIPRFFYGPESYKERESFIRYNGSVIAILLWPYVYGSVATLLLTVCIAVFVYMETLKWLPVANFVDKVLKNTVGGTLFYGDSNDDFLTETGYDPEPEKKFDSTSLAGPVISPAVPISSDVREPSDEKIVAGTEENGKHGD